MGNQPSQNILSLYAMYKQSISGLTKSKKRSETNKASISQLFESFQSQQYSWSKQISILFQQNFKSNFDLVWRANREDFYKLLLINCGQNIKGIVNYEDQFYERMGESQSYEGGLGEQGIKVINSSILDDEGCFPQCNKLAKKQKGLSSYLKDGEKYKKQQLQTHIQNSTVIIPQTVFIDRLSQETKVEINQFINFYKQFSNTLRQIINSSSLISCPMKHFQCAFNQKMQRKKIKKTQPNLNPRQSYSSELSHSKLISNAKQALQYRQKRQSNNNLLLIQLKDFTQAYSQFIWKYLALTKIENAHVGALITKGSVYSIVLKSVWSLTGWIGQRGFEWEENKLIQYFQQNVSDNKSNLVPESACRVMESLENERCPQKYLKKIVIFYRQISKKSQNADCLLDYVQKSIMYLVQKRKHNGIFRMKNIIEKIVRMDETNGQICYAWTTWNIVLEMLKSKINLLIKK